MKVSLQILKRLDSNNHLVLVQLCLVSSDVSVQVDFPHPPEADVALAHVLLLLRFFRRVVADENVLLRSKFVALVAPPTPAHVFTKTFGCAEIRLETFRAKTLKQKGHSLYFTNKFFVKPTLT